MVLKAAEPTNEQQAVISQLTNFIDPQAIACAVVEEMVDNDVPVSFENAERIYNMLLEELCEDLDGVCRAFFHRYNIER